MKAQADVVGSKVIRKMRLKAILFLGLAFVAGVGAIYLVRWYPTLAEGDPLVLPLEGIMSGSVAEATPPGNFHLFNLMYQMSRRLLAQAERPESPLSYGLAQHPLMRPGPYRRDNLALLLTVHVARQFLPSVSLAIYVLSRVDHTYASGRRRASLSLPCPSCPR